MRNYEAVFIFPAKEEEYNAGREFVRGLFQNAQANIVKEEDMGERDLTYTVKKEDRGHYYFFEAEMNPESISDIDKSLKIRADVLKYLFVNKEK
jgi:small subunit ribosomal protein S6